MIPSKSSPFTHRFGGNLRKCDDQMLSYNLIFCALYRRARRAGRPPKLSYNLIFPNPEDLLKELADAEGPKTYIIIFSGKVN